MREAPAGGQILVILALSLLVLILFVALAVDVGHFYAERRRMQNAADAGALAGAHALCFGDPAEAEGAAHDYAVARNGATTAAVDVSGGITVTVTAGESVATFFAGVIGIDQVAISARATAVCGITRGAGGVWPMAFSALHWPEDPQCGDWILLQQSDAADCEDWNCCVLFDEDREIAMFLPCDDDWVPFTPPLDRRAWIELGTGPTGNDPCYAPGFGDDEIIDRIVGRTPTGERCHSFVGMPSCLRTMPGAREDNWDATLGRNGEIVLITLYDPARSSNLTPGTHRQNPEACLLEGEDDRPRNTPRALVTGVVCLEIYEIDTIPGPYYLHGGPGKEDVVGGNRRKVLLTRIPCDDDGNPPPACASGLGWTEGSAPHPGDVRAVSLVE